MLRKRQGESRTENGLNTAIMFVSVTKQIMKHLVDNVLGQKSLLHCRARQSGKGRGHSTLGGHVMECNVLSFNGM